MGRNAKWIEPLPSGLRWIWTDPIPNKAWPSAAGIKRSFVCSEDSKGTIWAGTRHTLYLINDVQKPVLIPVSRFAGTAFRITNISCVYEDEGMLWVGSDHGLIQMRQQNGKIHHQRDLSPGSRSETRLVDNQVKSIVRDKRNQLWIGTAHRGLHLYDPVTSSFRRFQNATNNNRIASDHYSQTFTGQRRRSLDWYAGRTFQNANRHKRDYQFCERSLEWCQSPVRILYIVYIWTRPAPFGWDFFRWRELSLCIEHSLYCLLYQVCKKKLNNNVVSSILQDDEGDFMDRHRRRWHQSLQQ